MSKVKGLMSYLLAGREVQLRPLFLFGGGSRRELEEGGPKGKGQEDRESGHGQHFVRRDKNALKLQAQSSTSNCPLL